MLYVYTHFFCSTGKDASSCVVHLINDGVVVNGYDVSIQFLGSRSVRSYLCKMNDGSFYACERNQYQQLCSTKQKAYSQTVPNKFIHEVMGVMV